MRWRNLAAALSLGAAGCYRYVPIQAADARPNEEVRVHVTDAAAGRLAKELRAFNTRLDGPLARAGADSLSISIALARDAHTRQTLFLAPNEILDVQRRELSRGRTALATVGGLVAAGIVVARIAKLGNAGSDTGDRPPEPIPLLRPSLGLRLRVPLP